MWKAAAAGEPIDLARLAQREDSETLVTVVEDGGPMAPTALAALRAAPDAIDAVGSLCAVLSSERKQLRSAILSAIRAIVAQPPADVERIDPRGVAACEVPLRAAVHDETLTSKDRDLASSALQLLKEHRR